MTDKEFIDEIRRGIGIIVKAMIRKYGLSWDDFLPRIKGDYMLTSPIPANQNTSLPIVTDSKR